MYYNFGRVHQTLRVTPTMEAGLSDHMEYRRNRRLAREQLKLHSVLFLALLLTSCLSTLGCAEAFFELASESRLPRWFTLPKGTGRADLIVTRAGYVGIGRSAVFKLWDAHGHKLAQVTTVTDDYEPFTFGPRSPQGGFDARSYPLYELETANGISEVFEYRRMEPVVYINDDPVVRAALEKRARKPN